VFSQKGYKIVSTAFKISSVIYLLQLMHYVDVAVVAECVSDLADLCGTQVPLGTRVGVAHFLEAVMRLLGADLGPHVGRLVWAMVRGLEDRNAAVRTTFAQTLGHLLHIAEQNISQKVLAKLQKLYFDKQGNVKKLLRVNFLCQR